jgi:hypothetical protein
MLTLTSALPVPATVVVAVIFVLLMLVGSAVAEVAEAASVMIVPAAVPAFTCTTTVKVVEARLASVVVVFVQVRVSGVPDGAGQVQLVVVPEIVTVWKVVFVGITSVKVTGSAALWGPLLVNTWV